MSLPSQPGWLATDDRLPLPDVSTKFLTAMSALAATVTVVAATKPDGDRCGITATAVCSLSADPALLVVCVNRSSTLAKTMTQTGWFSVNLLNGDQEGLAGTFAGQSGLSGEQRFTSGTWSTHGTGVPILGGAAATCICHLANSLNIATHLIVVGAVHDVLLPANHTTSPLMYHQRRFTTIASMEEGNS